MIGLLSAWKGCARPGMHARVGARTALYDNSSPGKIVRDGLRPWLSKGQDLYTILRTGIWKPFSWRFMVAEQGKD